jgi:spoIIIJ-associated protein
MEERPMDERTGPETPPPPHAPEKVEKALAFCRGLLERLGAAVDVEVKETPDAIGVSLTAREGNRVELNSALVEAAQYLVNRVVNPRAEGRKWVNLDVGGFREEGDPAVKAMAERLAATAKRTGKAIAVAPISARDRRQIHLALVDVEGISTRSEGEGLFRQLLVIPSSKPSGGAGGA